MALLCSNGAHDIQAGDRACLGVYLVDFSAERRPGHNRQIRMQQTDPIAIDIEGVARVESIPAPVYVPELSTTVLCTTWVYPACAFEYCGSTPLASVLLV